MVDSAAGSRNPADSEELSGALREIFGKWLASEIDDMLPCVVIAYDRQSNRATLKPLIQTLKTDLTLQSKEQIPGIPCINIGGGNAVLSFNIIPGDLGWIKASDRDISLFLQSMAEAGPNTLRKHKFNDALFIPDKFRNWVLNAEDESNCVLQSLDGTVRIAIWDDRIKLTAPSIDFDTPIAEFFGDVIIDGKASLGGIGGPAIARIGDTVAGGVITSGSTDHTAT